MTAGSLRLSPDRRAADVTRLTAAFVAASLQHLAIALAVAHLDASIPAPPPRGAPLIVHLGHLGTGAVPSGGGLGPAAGDTQATLTTAASSPPPPAIAAKAPFPIPPVPARKPSPRPAPSRTKPPATTHRDRESTSRPGSSGHDTASANLANGVGTATGPAVDGGGGTSGTGGGSGSGADAGEGATYRARLLAWLDRHKRYPARARAIGLEGRILLRLALDRSGRVTSHALESEGGYALFAQEAEAMIRRADPFPAVPAAIPGNTFELVVPIEFRLQDGRRRG